MWGKSVTVSLFGESHGSAVGVNIAGLPAGIALDFQEIQAEMRRRAPGFDALSTPRREADEPEILSGYFNGFSTGAPLCALIRNQDARAQDYEALKNVMRPGHADYTAYVKHNGFQDHRGGGHFSGRLTAPLVFAGAICKQILAQKNIVIGAHVRRIHDVSDVAFDADDLTADRLASLRACAFPVLNPEKGEKMQQRILEAKAAGDSVGGVVECAIVGLDSGIGLPFFDSVESTIAHLAFSIPAMKGIEFGTGFALAKRRGSEVNDPFYYDEGGTVKTRTNHNGGVLGGITTGMPIVFSCAFKPTPSIAKAQTTIDVAAQKQASLQIKGRHDPCLVLRALPVVEAVAAIAVLELMKRSV